MSASSQQCFRNQVNTRHTHATRYALFKQLADCGVGHGCFRQVNACKPSVSHPRPHDTERSYQWHAAHAGRAPSACASCGTCKTKHYTVHKVPLRLDNSYISLSDGGWGGLKFDKSTSCPAERLSFALKQQWRWVLALSRVAEHCSHRRSAISWSDSRAGGTLAW